MENRVDCPHELVGGCRDSALVTDRGRRGTLEAVELAVLLALCGQAGGRPFPVDQILHPPDASETHDHCLPTAVSGD